MNGEKFQPLQQGFSNINTVVPDNRLTDDSSPSVATTFLAEPTKNQPKPAAHEAFYRFDTKDGGLGRVFIRFEASYLAGCVYAYATPRTTGTGNWRHCRQTALRALAARSTARFESMCGGLTQCHRTVMNRGGYGGVRFEPLVDAASQLVLDGNSAQQLSLAFLYHPACYPHSLSILLCSLSLSML